ncbi:DUF2085 domain-containing protein [bacterium]|nr:MAG: DUF2085 domain-containing protein [bacterium]
MIVPPLSHHKKEEVKWVVLLAVLPIIILLAAISSAIPELQFIVPFNKLWLQQICHTQADRAFQINNEPMIICTRCTGIYLAFATGIISSFFISLKIASYRMLKIILGITFVIILVDVSGNFFLFWENTNLTRFLTGILFGASLSLFFIAKKIKT